jgi:hypothetical protein
MNRDDIIRMAREAQMSPSADGMYWTATLSDLEKFAAAEREACAKLCEESNDIGSSYGLAQAIRARGQA